MITQSAPVFVQPLPTHVDDVMEGDSLHLECQIKPVNDGSLIIGWYRDNAPIPASHRFKYFHNFGNGRIRLLIFLKYDVKALSPSIYRVSSLKTVERINVLQETCSVKHIRPLTFHAMVRRSFFLVKPYFCTNIVC